MEFWDVIALEMDYKGVDRTYFELSGGTRAYRVAKSAYVLPSFVLFTYSGNGHPWPFSLLFLSFFREHGS